MHHLTHTRRAFLATAAAAAAAPALAAHGSRPAAPAPAARTLKIGIASYSMRKFTLDQALAMANTIGIKHMTFKDVHLPRTDSPEAITRTAGKSRRRASRSWAAARSR